MAHQSRRSHHMKTYTLDDLRDPESPYDLTRHFPKGWTGTLISILQATWCPLQDRLRIVSGLLSNCTNRLLAVWCARKALATWDNVDPRCAAACDTAERYATGQATDEELLAARHTVWAMGRSSYHNYSQCSCWNIAWSTTLKSAQAAVNETAMLATRQVAWYLAHQSHPDGAPAFTFDDVIAHLIEMLEKEDNAEHRSESGGNSPSEESMTKEELHTLLSEGRVRKVIEYLINTSTAPDKPEHLPCRCGGRGVLSDLSDAECYVYCPQCSVRTFRETSSRDAWSAWDRAQRKGASE